MSLCLNKNNNNSLVSSKTIHNQIFSIGMAHKVFKLQTGYVSEDCKLALWKFKFIFGWKQHHKLYFGPPSYFTLFYLMGNETKIYAERIIETVLVPIRDSNESIFPTVICYFCMLALDEYQFFREKHLREYRSLW